MFHPKSPVAEKKAAPVVFRDTGLRTGNNDFRRAGEGPDGRLHDQRSYF